MPKTALTKYKTLTPKQRRFVNEYLVSKNGTDAAIASGTHPKNAASVASQWLNSTKYAHIQEAVAKALYEQELRAEKKADDILAYIHVAMYFTPSRYFMPGGNGGWLIDEENYKKLPDEIGRLIEEVESQITEFERPDGSKIKRIMFWVRFVSKTKAMDLAAKHQLGERHNLTITNVDWSEMYKRNEPKTIDVIDQKMKALLGPAKESP